MKKLALPLALIFGLGLLGFSAKFGFSTYRLKESASIAMGVVVDYETIRSSDGKTYAPIIEFETSHGDKISFQSKMSSSRPKYALGQEIELLYDPLYPDDARINTFFALWGAAIIAGIMGAFVTALSSLLLFFTSTPDDDDDDEEDDGWEEEKIDFPTP